MANANNDVSAARYTEAYTGLWAYHAYKFNVVLDGVCLTTRPDWLKAIVDIAKVGGHGVSIVSPPPNYILWLRVHRDNTIASMGYINERMG